jgi:hypothetical protein
MAAFSPRYAVATKFNPPDFRAVLEDASTVARSVLLLLHCDGIRLSVFAWR